MDFLPSLGLAEKLFFFFFKRNRAIFAVGLQLPLHLSIDTIKISLNKEFKLGHNINNNR